MLLRRLRALLTTALALLVLAPVLGSNASVRVWLCEGRICGWRVCCCEDNGVASRKDPNCDRSAPDETSLCGADCGCTLQIQSSNCPHAKLTHLTPHVPPLLYVLPPTPSLPAPALSCARPSQPTAPRGPPITGWKGALPTLRAPPAS